MKRSLWLAVGAAAMFGTSYGAAKIATEELAPMGAVLLRYVFGTLFLGVLVATTRRGRVGGVRRRAPWPALLAMAVFGLVGYQTFFFASLRYTAVFNTALINALSPVITGLLAAAFLRERLPRRSWAGIALVVLGVVTLLSRGNPARLLALELNRGDALMLGAVTSFAIHSLVVRRVAGASGADPTAGRRRLLPAGVPLRRDGRAVEGDQPAVRDGDPVGVERQVGEDGFRTRERRLGVDDPALLPDRRKMAQKGPPLGKVRK